MGDGKSHQTYTRQERFLPMVMSEEVKQSDDSDLLVLCAKCSELQRRLRMRKAKEGERARPYILQLILG